MISDEQLIKLCSLIEDGRQDNFYAWHCWKRVAAYVKRLDNFECQHCKLSGKFSRGEIVHHVKHLTDRPELALSVFDPETGERQLITLCRECHEREHPERLKPFALAAPLTSERWD